MHSLTLCIVYSVSHINCQSPRRDATNPAKLSNVCVTETAYINLHFTPFDQIAFTHRTEKDS